MLDQEARAELRPLNKDTADTVARHLVVTGRLVDEAPEQALAHGRAARALAGRVSVVREAAGLAAYAAGEWTEALADLRAARRISGRPEHLAVMADCERALGRPERALAVGDDPDVPRLSQVERVELAIVLAGARRDLGQADAAVLMLQDPARRTASGRPWATRLWYAFADALLDAGRVDDAREWFSRAAQSDTDATTDAAERLLALDGVVFDDVDEDEPAEQHPVAGTPQEGLAEPSPEYDASAAGARPQPRRTAGGVDRSQVLAAFDAALEQAQQRPEDGTAPADAVPGVAFRAPPGDGER
jgi:tetratricopeptide (TPR) repeat protein